MKLTSFLLSPDVRSGLFELDSEGKIRDSRLKMRNGFVEAHRDWHDTFLFDQLTELQNIDKLAQTFRYFVRNRQLSDNIIFESKVGDTDISFEIMMLRVHEQQALIRNKLMIMEIKRSDYGH